MAFPVEKMVIKLVRHGESRANTKEHDPQASGDHIVGLTDRGKDQAKNAAIDADFLRRSLIFVSPYRRTMETLTGILDGRSLDREKDGLRIYQDPRVREVEHGYKDVEQQAGQRETHGWFYYRFEGGESPADCYDRVSGFIDSMFRQCERKETTDVVIVTHGLTIRCFVMRFLHLDVADFEKMANPGNAEVITIARGLETFEPTFSRGKWKVANLKVRRDA